jgi:hypothetical protein
MRRLSIVAVALMVPLCACVQQRATKSSFATIQRPAPDDAVPHGIAYTCENHKEVLVVYAKNRATITFGDKTWRTEYQGESNGFRYADSSIQWTGRDDLAALRENFGTARPLAYNCRPTRRTT